MEDTNCEPSDVRRVHIEAYVGHFIVWSQDCCSLRRGWLDDP